MHVAQETLGLRRAGLSPALSLLMSAFALPIPPAEFTLHLHRPTERSPTIQETEIRNDVSRHFQPLTMPCSIFDRLVLVAPALPRRRIDVSKVVTEATPHTH